MPETQTTAKLAEALAAFQARVGAIPRTREVKVETRSGGSYKFKYAPHEGIIEHIRKPLGEAGLSVSQHLSSLQDGVPALRTMLLHSSGERIEDVFPLPTRDGMTAQELGSAVTYVRRYALSAILGLATDDDDDGNRASGTSVTGRSDRGATESDGSLIGTALLEKKRTTDFELRQSPQGAFLGFRLKAGAGAGVICETRGQLAESLAAIRDFVVGKRVQVWGAFHDYEPPVVEHAYRAFRVDRIVTPEYDLPGPAEAPSLEMFSPDESRALDEALGVA